MRKIIREIPRVINAPVPLWLAMAVVLTVGAVGAAINVDNQATPAPAPTVTVEADPEPEPTDYVDLEADHVKLTVKVLGKSCIDTCFVDYRVEAAYDGPGELDPAKTYEVTYRVTGGDVPVINTLTMTGNTFESAGTEYTTTDRAGDKLKARVTRVAEQ